MLVKHVRDAYRKPFATLVQVDKDHLGVVIWKEYMPFDEDKARRIWPHDRAFNRKEAVAVWKKQNSVFSKEQATSLAIERARTGEQPIMPQRDIIMYFQVEDFHGFYSMEDILSDEIQILRSRAARYFKNKEVELCSD